MITSINLIDFCKTMEADVNPRLWTLCNIVRAFVGLNSACYIAFDVHSPKQKRVQ